MMETLKSFTFRDMRRRRILRNMSGKSGQEKVTHNEYIENIDVATDTLVDISRERGSGIRCLELVRFQAGFEALSWAEACDILLGREPKDWDITTNAVPEEIQKIFERLL